jgi:hypothetical protein
MLQAGGCACFPVEALAQLRSNKDVGPRDFQRHFAAELRIVGQVNNPETTAAQFPADLKAAEGSRRQEARLRARPTPHQLAYFLNVRNVVLELWV